MALARACLHSSWGQKYPTPLTHADNETFYYVNACRPSTTVCASPDPFFLASFYHRVCSNCSTLAASRVTATMTPLVFMANGISVIEVLPRFCPFAFCTLHRLHLFLALRSLAIPIGLGSVNYGWEKFWYFLIF